MSWIEKSLTRLEARLRATIEGDAARDGLPRRFHSQLFNELVNALQEDMKRCAGNLAVGDYTPPDRFTLVLPTDEAQLLLAHPSALDRLAHRLQSSTAHLKIHFDKLPMLCVVANPNIQGLKVSCAHSQAGGGSSLTVELDGQAQNPCATEAGMKLDAFLIVNGLSTYRLIQPVINIGSDPANQLVLDHPGVSPRHAQLRFSSGKYVIFDLDSRRGTFVNGVPISSRQLNPGDVILLGGVPLVYGEASIPRMGYTQELPPAPPTPEVL